MIEALRQALRLPHSTLTIRVLGWPYRLRPYHIGNLYCKFYCLHAFGDESPAFGKINQLVLQCETRIDIDIEHCRELLLDSMYKVPMLVAGLSESAQVPKLLRSWVATEIGGGREPLEGALFLGLTL